MAVAAAVFLSFPFNPTPPTHLKNKKIYKAWFYLNINSNKLKKSLKNTTRKIWAVIHYLMFWIKQSIVS